MNIGQWNTLRNCANMAEAEQIPVALLADCLWIPTHTGVEILDYFTSWERWLAANLQIASDFPEVIFIPGFWVEYGMATEASAFGCKPNFYAANTPTVANIITAPDEVARIAAPNPRRDGLMPFILNTYRRLAPLAQDAGHPIKIVASKGPLTIAAHIMGMTEFLVGIKLDPDNSHRLLKLTTQTVKQWLTEQAEVLPDVAGILVLDDLAGFLSKNDYLEFAHPYLKEIFTAFPDWLKIYHNDTDNVSSYPFVRDLQVNIFHFTHLQNIAKVRELVGEGVVLMGNIPPLDSLAQGTPQNVLELAGECILQHGSKAGLLLSAGGATLAGTPGANIRTLVRATRAGG
jgi:uroporphyrinogen decarboxylase